MDVAVIQRIARVEHLEFGPARMSKPAHPVILITGCSSGIGLALAKILVNSSYRLILTSHPRSLSKLVAEGIVDSDSTIVRGLDVSRPAEHFRVVDEGARRWGGIDILVNNAGVAFRSVIEEMDALDEQEQLTINYLGPINLVRLVLPHMRQQRWGRIINVSSVGGMMAMPTMGSYSASKFALEGASEALWYEMRPWGIGVTLIEPGFVNSESFKRVHYTRRSSDEHSPYHSYYEHMARFIARLMRISPATPERIASLIVRAINEANPPLRIQATPDAKFFSLLRRLLPRGVYHRLLYYSLPGVKHWVGAHDS